MNSYFTAKPKPEIRDPNHYTLRTRECWFCNTETPHTVEHSNGQRVTICDACGCQDCEAK